MNWDVQQTYGCDSQKKISLFSTCFVKSKYYSFLPMSTHQLGELRLAWASSETREASLLNPAELLLMLGCNTLGGKHYLPYPIILLNDAIYFLKCTSPLFHQHDAATQMLHRWDGVLWIKNLNFLSLSHWSLQSNCPISLLQKARASSWWSPANFSLFLCFSVTVGV